AGDRLPPREHGERSEAGGDGASELRAANVARLRDRDRAARGERPARERRREALPASRPEIEREGAREDDEGFEGAPADLLRDGERLRRHVVEHDERRAGGDEREERAPEDRSGHGSDETARPRDEREPRSGLLRELAPVDVERARDHGERQRQAAGPAAAHEERGAGGE